MHRSFATICLIDLVMLSSIAWGQAGAPRGGVVPAAMQPLPASGALIPAWSPGGGAARSTAFGELEPEQVEPAPATVKDGLPADPDPARWGNYGQPARVPVALPAVEYSLVGPPRGWIQPNVPPEYRAVVADPATVPDNDIMLTQAIDLNRADGLAPSGVFGAVTLPTGRFMASYGYLQNSFDHLLVGTHQVSSAGVLAKYAFAPTRGLSDSQIATITYGVTDDLTITASLPFEHNQIDYTQTGGTNLRTAFSNPGDVRLSALYVLRRTDRHQWHANLGMSIPVGFLETLPQLQNPTFPNLPTYALRTSSGTYDLLPGLTYRGQADRWSWGAQASGVVRLGFNTLGYKLGDQVNMTVWTSRLWTHRLSSSARLDSNIWGNIAGLDSRLNPALSPTNVTLLQGGRRVDLLFGLNYYLPASRIPGQYLTVEGGFPVYQSLDGPQLGVNWILNAGWNMVW
jgi:hypothetical protein